MGKSYCLQQFDTSLNKYLYDMKYVCLSTVFSVGELHKQLDDQLGLETKDSKTILFNAIQDRIHYSIEIFPSTNMRYCSRGSVLKPPAPGRYLLRSPLPSCCHQSIMPVAAVFICKRFPNHCRFDRVQVYIPADFQEIPVILDQAGRVPGIKQVSIIAIFLIEHPGVMVHHRLHDLPDRVVHSRKFQMKMVRHQAVCLKDKRVPVLYFLQQPEEKAVVIPVAIDHAMPVAPSHDVVTCPFIPFPLFSRRSAPLSSLCIFNSAVYNNYIVYTNIRCIYKERPTDLSNSLPFSCPAAFL